MSFILGFIYLLSALGFISFAAVISGLQGTPNLKRGLTGLFGISALAMLLYGADALTFIDIDEWPIKPIRVTFACFGIGAGLYTWRVIRNGAPKK